MALGQAWLAQGCYERLVSDSLAVSVFFPKEGFTLTRNEKRPGYVWSLNLKGRGLPVLWLLHLHHC